MHVLLDEIEKRQAARKDVLRKVAEMGPPLIQDSEDVKDHTKKIKDAQAEYLDNTFLQDYDMDRLKFIVFSFCNDNKETVEKFLKIATDQVPLSVKERDRLDQLRQKEEEAKAAAEGGEAKDPNEVPGQLKMFGKPGKKVKDDGSVAEPAGDVKSRKIKDGE